MSSPVLAVWRLHQGRKQYYYHLESHQASTLEQACRVVALQARLDTLELPRASWLHVFVLFAVYSVYNVMLFVIPAGLLALRLPLMVVAGATCVFELAPLFCHGRLAQQLSLLFMSASSKQVLFKQMGNSLLDRKTLQVTLYDVTDVEAQAVASEAVVLQHEALCLLIRKHYKQACCQICMVVGVIAAMAVVCLVKARVTIIYWVWTGRAIVLLSLLAWMYCRRKLRPASCRQVLSTVPIFVELLGSDGSAPSLWYPADGTRRPVRWL